MLIQEIQFCSWLELDSRSAVEGVLLRRAAGGRGGWCQLFARDLRGGPLRFGDLVIKFHTCELQVTICRKWHKTEQNRTSGAVTEEMMDLRASGCAGWKTLIQ